CLPSLWRLFFPRPPGQEIPFLPKASSLGLCSEMRLAAYSLLCQLSGPFPRPSPQGTPEVVPSPILRHLSSTRRYTALRHAASRSGGLQRTSFHRLRHSLGLRS